MRKSKGQTVDFLYTDKKTSNKKASSKKSTNKSKKKTKRPQNSNNQVINLDNEIIIGLTPKKEENKKPQNKKKQGSKNKQNKKRNNKVKSKKKNAEKRNSNGSQTNKKSITKNKQPKRKRNLKLIKWMSIIILLALAIALFMMSSIFNIKQIVVLNNSKILSEEIISLSTLTPGINMFKTTNKTIRSNIKANPYIENVNIKRNINGTVTLEVEERIPTYMIKFANAYVYINNQGYMLEVSETPLELPTITGFTTSEEEIKAGNRLGTEDLKKLEDVIKIIESSKNSPLADIITEIDISDSLNYKLTIKSEKKTILFGDTSNINIKLQMTGKVISSEKGKVGEIYFQEGSKKAVFKEQVTR